MVAFGVFEGTELLVSTLALPDWTTTLVVVLGIVSFPLALVLAWAYETGPDGIQRDPGPDDRETGRPPSPPRSLAVLPLATLSGDPENQYFGDGLAEEILGLLGRLPQLRVPSRTSSFSYRDTTLDLREIAHRLDVEAVLEGSVRRVGNRVRITAQLVDARTDDHLWAETYDREIEDVFALQEEIARSIVGALELRLGPEDRRALEKDTTTGNVRAYDFYLRGRQYFFQLDRGGLEFAREMFLKAIEADPDYALAWAGLAQTTVWLATWAEDTPERRKEAEEASGRALALAPERAESHTARGHALTLDQRWDEAETHFEHAIRLDPGLYDAWYLYARARFAQGRLEDAADLFGRAADLRPEDYQSRALLAQTLVALKRHDEARAVAREAAEAAERHLERNPHDSRALTLGAGAWIDAGDPERGRRWAERAVQMHPTDVPVLHNAACAFASAGEIDRALDLLERRVRLAPTISRAWIEHDPDFEPLRQHDRFQKLLEGLA